MYSRILVYLSCASCSSCLYLANTSGLKYTLREFTTGVHWLLDTTGPTASRPLRPHMTKRVTAAAGGINIFQLKVLQRRGYDGETAQTLTLNGPLRQRCLVRLEINRWPKSSLEKPELLPIKLWNSFYISQAARNELRGSFEFILCFSFQWSLTGWVHSVRSFWFPPKHGHLFYPTMTKYHSHFY